MSKQIYITMIEVRSRNKLQRDINTALSLQTGTLKGITLASVPVRVALFPYPSGNILQPPLVLLVPSLIKRLIG